MFKEGKPVKAVKGMAKIKNSVGKKGLKGLAAKKPVAKIKKGGAVVSKNGSLSALKAKNPGPKKAKSKQEIKHAKRAVKLANYKF